MKRFYFLLIFLGLISSAPAGDIISLTWNQVVDISRKENLDIRIMNQDYRIQKLNEWKAMADFLPTVDYSFRAVNNLELPVFVFMGRSFRVGTKYDFTHSLQLQFPVFLGGMRFANRNIQRNSKRSLAQLLKGKEEEVVLKSVEAYFQVILTNDLVVVNQKAFEAAKANYEQVEKFYNEGSASRLDLLRAKTRFSESKPNLTSALNARKMAVENLKFILNLNAEDSVVVLDTLSRKDFLKEFAKSTLKELQDLALANRTDLKSLQFQKQIAQNQKLIAGSRFLPQIIVSAGVQHQALLQNRNVTWDDYSRIKSASVILQFPLFEGGKRILDLQQAFIQNKKISLQTEQLKKAVLLEVNNRFNAYREAAQNLVTLKQAFKEAGETLRLANLTYKEGLSTQVEVLNAQLSFTNSEARYRRGMFDYNISQLRLLKAIGKLDTIWEN